MRGAWTRVINSRELGNFISVHAAFVPGVFLPIDALKEAGVYERVRAILDERNARFREDMAAALERAT